jgi:hypothetical protein
MVGVDQKVLSVIYETEDDVSLCFWEMIILPYLYISFFFFFF